MFKTCGPSICKSLEIIFKLYLESGNFPLEWKSNVVPVHKKMANNVPVDLLVTCRI